jgi:hypothetical protein
MRRRSVPVPSEAWAVPKSSAGKDHQVILGAGDDTNEVLVLIVKAMKQRQPLLTVSRIIEQIDVQGKLRSSRCKRFDQAIDEPIFHPRQVGGGHRILQTRNRRLTRQVQFVGSPLGNQFEDRIRTQGIVVILIFIPGEYSVDTLTHHAQDRVRAAIPAIDHAGRERFRPSQFSVQLEERKQPRIRRKMLFNLLHLKRNSLHEP